MKEEKDLPVPAGSWRAVPASVWTLGFVSLLMDISSELVHSLLPLFLVTVVGASALAIGVIEGIAEATAAFAKVFSGVLSDRLGKRKWLAGFGYGLSAVAKLAFPLVSTAGGVLGARFVDRVGKGIRGAPRDALIADITPAPVRGAAYGLRQALDTVGALAGPLLAMLLMALYAGDFRAVFWWAVLPAALAVLLIVAGVREPGGVPARRDAPWPVQRAALRQLSGAYWAVVAIGVLFTLARFSEAFLLLRAQSAGMALAAIPLVMVLMNLVYALVATPAGVLSDRIGRMPLLLAGLLALVLADLLLAFLPGVWGVLAGVACWGLHLGLTQGLLAALVADAAPSGLRGTAFGMFNLLTGLALLLASVVAGALWHWLGPAATFVAGAAFAAVSAVALLLRMQSGIFR